MVFLELWWEGWGSSRVATGKSGNSLLPQGNQASFHVARGHFGIPFESKQGNQSSSRDEVGNKGLFSSRGGKLGVPLEFPEVSVGTS